MRSLVLALWFCILATPAWAITVVNGSYTGNGTDNTDITISPACQPIAVFVKRDVGTREMYARFSSMGANVSKEVTGAAAQATDGIKVLNSDGFRLGSGPSVNFNGGTHYYTAICDNGAGDVSVDTWAGNNVSARTITTTPSITPELVIILQSSTGLNTWRGATSHSGDLAARMNSLTADGADAIQAFGVGSFEVGTAQNATGTTYYSLALASSTGVATGTFTGNGSDNRAITTVAVPKMVAIKGNSTTKGLAYRLGDIAGDLSFCDIAASAANIIQALNTTDFTLGTDTCANENAVTMRWFAFTEFTVPSGARPMSPIIFE